MGRANLLCVCSSGWGVGPGGEAGAGGRGQMMWGAGHHGDEQGLCPVEDLQLLWVVSSWRAGTSCASPPVPRT